MRQAINETHLLKDDPFAVKISLVESNYGLFAFFVPNLGNRTNTVEKLIYRIPGKLNIRIIIGKIFITKTSSTMDDDSRSSVTSHTLQQHMSRSSSTHSMNNLYTTVLLSN